MHAHALLSWLWPLLLVFLPTWAANAFLPAPAGASLLWNPLDILTAWPPAIHALFAYSASFACGCLLMLAICLFWWLRFGGGIYALLLFCASFMTGPTWTVFVRLWHYFQG